MFNSTMIIRTINDVDYNLDTFPLSYENDNFDFSSITINRSYYDDFLSSLNKTTTTSSSIFSFSSPFILLLLIVSSYFILTIILLTFSLYKQRQTEIENFYFGDTDEEIEQGKRQLAWKQLLIGKIQKGDMQPLLIDRNDQQQRTFPLDLV